LTVNVYYTISNSVVLDLFSGPFNYTSSLNYTKGNLAATGYRTKTSDSWNFKYYRYDVRGRVIKLWNIISDFDTLITEYYYNSQDQITIYSHSGHGDVKTYRNTYDYTGRLYKVDYYTGSPDAPNPDYLNLAEYGYNPNSQISIQKYNDAFMQNEYSYNERNWITEVDNSSKLFKYSNQYFKNGNVKSMEISGDYSQNYAAPSGLEFEYEYDRSNRLTKATNGENIFEVINTYDKDGNILSLERHGSTGVRIEAFNYIYYSGTNKLQRVSAARTQYTYDANGNMISDALNKNVNIEYDHRNLIMELEHTKYILNDSLILLTKYYYDEAGNRIRKMTYDTEDDSLKSDIIYSRDVSGRELAVYENDSIKQWNLFGLDNIGYMTGSDDLRFYLKDHLGSVRVVTDDQSAVINCQDYDPWGYVLENRVYESDESVYKFTSKERDEESEYDYFGARYYDTRIANWGSVDPLLEKHYDYSPYNYVLRNPLKLVDPDGRQIDFYYLNGSNSATMILINPFIDVTRIYVEHSQGNILGPNEKGLGEKTFFEANSEATMFRFLEQNDFYQSSSLVTDFEYSEFLTRVADALSEYQSGMDPETYAKKQSYPGMKMDQKNNLSDMGLYLFQNTVYSKFEAGNIIWGATMMKLGIPLWKTIAGAEYYTYKTYLHPDQENESQAIQEGYKYFQKEK